uniref:Magnesium transporter n=2 Tax=Mesocestoides corti TaxID=53468 RepID=A0A5K3FWZ9_MESCO
CVFIICVYFTRFFAEYWLQISKFVERIYRTINHRRMPKHAPPSMRKTMKRITIPTSCGRSSFFAENNSSNESLLNNSEAGCTQSPENERKSYHDLENVEHDGTVVAVDEIYQLGIEHKENNEIYLFDFVDSLQVSYPVTLSHVSTDRLEKLPPYFHGRLFDEHLSCLASDVFRQLTSRLETWMDALDANAQTEFIARHMKAHEELTILRRQIFTLLKLLVPNPSLSDGFDCTTADLDRLLVRIISEISKSGSSSTDGDENLSLPIVSVCIEPEHCVQVLRQRVLTLLQTLLPSLRLPKSFDITRDLHDLINAVYSYNTQKF